MAYLNFGQFAQAWTLDGEFVDLATFETLFRRVQQVFTRIALLAIQSNAHIGIRAGVSLISREYCNEIFSD
jgi:hypothetical protein